MNITTNERVAAEKLTALFLEYKHSLPYANVSTTNTYLGWVSDFRLSDTAGNRIRLDLRDEQDLFLLFVLAVGWSRTGAWENPAFLVAQLKLLKKNSPAYWMEHSNCLLEKQQCAQAAAEATLMLQGYKARKKISYRGDIYDSIHILANRWPQIVDALKKADRTGDFHPFMEHMRVIEGLGSGTKKMLMKIPLILRELRCQGIHTAIPGEYCCVPDARVIGAAGTLGIKLPTASTFDRLKAGSAKIYKLFGDLYDLPLFAFEDLPKEEVRRHLNV